MQDAHKSGYDDLFFGWLLIYKFETIDFYIQFLFRVRSRFPTPVVQIRFRAKGQRVQAQTNGEPVGNFEWKQVLSHSIPEGPTYSPWFCKILNNYKPRGVPKPPSSGGEKGSGALEALPPLAGSSMQSPPGPGRSIIIHLLWEKRSGTLGFSGS